jgi:hypothetical protein
MLRLFGSTELSLAFRAFRNMVGDAPIICFRQIGPVDRNSLRHVLSQLNVLETAPQR